MSIIKIENLTFSYPSSAEVIFDNVNFQIDTDWKLGFVGRNGRGKTTFLNLLQGRYEYSGKIISSVKFNYFPYSVPDKSVLTQDVLRQVCPTAEDWEFIRELSYLEVNSEVLYRPFETLSNGEQSKVLLSALFLNEGNFLLIDEPTNHLDSNARQMVAKYIKKKKSFILVSHDRDFLDGCVDHILSLNRANIEVQSGNFSLFMLNFERRQMSEQMQNDRLKQEIKRLKQSARQSAEWSDKIESGKIGNKVFDRGYVGHKAAKMMQLSKNLENRQKRAIEQKTSLLKNTESAESLKISPLDYRVERLAYYSAVAPLYKGKQVCAPVTFEILRGDRIALEGKNGSGKSSLLKLLCGLKTEYSGELGIGSGLIISYVPQDTSHLRGTLDAFSSEYKIDKTLFAAILHKLGFDKSQFGKDIYEFSDGQKKKALIAKSLCEHAHLYVWDEPLNFIDVYSRMQIEELLLQYRPTMIFVEHDSAFRKKISTSVIEL